MTGQDGSSMQDQAYQFIRRKIEYCEYAPHQMLSESLLRDELGFSRTPVREAIRRMAQEGLVKVFPKSGIVVNGISINTNHKIYEVRFLIEPYVLMMYHRRLNIAEIERFAALFHAYKEGERWENLYDIDDKFHAELISAMDNGYLLELYDRIHVQSVRLRVMSGEHIESRKTDTMREHAKIADACIKSDWRAASRAMTEHLSRSKESSFAAIMKNAEPNIC